MTQTALLATVLFLVCATAAWFATRLVLTWLERRAILDRPNERSSHSRPTPRGGGLAVVAVALGAGTILALLSPFVRLELWIVLGGTAALAALSWLDDLKDLSAALRLLVHAVVVTVALAALPAGATVFQGWLPPLLDRLLAGLLWIWFINLFNFMDGIDGIAGVETVTLGGGVFILSLLLPGTLAFEGQWGLAIAGAALGFLLWNWHPARIFLGDVGSVPLGFVLGWLLLETAAAGQWAAALILPLYYLADATITLARRALRGEKIWRAHREHFYQMPIARGWRHDAVTLRIAAANAALLLCAVLAARGTPLVALPIAIAIVAALLVAMARAGRRAG